MNQPLFLHIVERLESFLGKLPASIQKPVLQELTPLKELFLKQRAPRLVLTGAHKLPLQEVVAALFAAAQPGDLSDTLMEVNRWQEMSVSGHGNVQLLDARGADAAALRKVEAELEREPADIFLHIADGSSARPTTKTALEVLRALANFHRTPQTPAKIIGVTLAPTRRARVTHNGHGHAEDGGVPGKLQTALEETPGVREFVIQTVELTLPEGVTEDGAADHPGAFGLMSLLVQHVPNQARVEMIRVSRDRQAQVELAQMLVKSTSAICTAVGAQPIPLADLPILTTLQLVMVSGIMHLAGRERSLRAATEFVAALGVNVGTGMVLREGARAMLKFFPGWGNVVCGMVAGAGTYALGRGAIAYFLEGVTLKDARRIYLRSRKRKPRAQFLPASEAPTRHARR